MAGGSACSSSKGPPGARRMIRKEIVMIASSVGTSMAMRRIAYANIFVVALSRSEVEPAARGESTLGIDFASRDYHVPQFVNHDLPFVSDTPPFVNNGLPTAAAPCTTDMRQLHGYRTSIR